VNELFYFVDLPGYGFAKTSLSIRKKWEKLIETYLQTRKQLKIVLFLLDIRRIPNDHDKMLNKWFQSLNDIKTIYVLTKSDKLSKAKREKQRTKIALELFTDRNDFIFYSTLKDFGKSEILKKIESVIK
jgi:GTP-binding protein